MKTVRTLAVLMTGIGVSVAALPALAQAYPSKPVRVIVPVSPGSGLDVSTRLVTQRLSEIWAQPVVVDNRTGAGTTIGTGLVAKSAPNGHTLLVNSSAFTQSPAIYANLPYDIRKDFVSVAPLVSAPYVLVVGPSVSMKTIGELIAAAKAKPGQLNFGSVGMGTATHLAAEKFRLATGINVVHVPYKGGPEAMIDTMTGRVTYWFPPIGIALPHLRDGKLLALGVTSARRSDLLPGVPTIAEAGVGGFEDKIWFGMWAPASTPAHVVNKIAKDIALVYSAQDLRDRLTNLAFEPLRMTQAEFARFVESEIASTARIINAAGIKPQ